MFPPAGYGSWGAAHACADHGGPWMFTRQDIADLAVLGDCLDLAEGEP